MQKMQKKIKNDFIFAWKKEKKEKLICFEITIKNYFIQNLKTNKKKKNTRKNKYHLVKLSST